MQVTSNSMTQNSGPVEPPNPEKYKEILKNENTPPKEAAAAMTHLSNLLFSKEQNSTATDDEKALLNLMKDAYKGQISGADNEQLASKLGMNTDKLTEVTNIVAPPDKGAIKQ